MARLVTTAIVVSTLLLPRPSAARSWFVNAEGTGDAPTIQAAADSSSPGDTVLVGPGTFHEQVDLSAPVTLRGMAGPAATTIDGGSDYGNCVESRNLDGVSIESLRFVGATAGGYGFTGYGVYAEGGVTVRDCIFENGGPSGGFGAVNVHWGDLTLLDSEVRFGEGVLFSGSSLLVEGCLFEEGRYSWNFLSYVKITWSTTRGLPTLATISGNVFRDNGGSPVIGWDRAHNPDGSLTLLVEGNLFVANEGPALAFQPRPPSKRALGCAGTASVIVRNNTIARHTGYTIGWNSPPFCAEHVIVLERNAITGNQFGPYFDPPPQPTISCNDVWANGVNWTGIPDPTGVDGNISLEPKYCDAANGNFTVAANSPLWATNNSCQAQIGAFGVGCAPTSVEPASWGKIKSLYRIIPVDLQPSPGREVAR